MFYLNVFCTSVVIFFLVASAFVSAHSHGHAHSDEPPHLKYTREVNEAATKGADAIGQHQHGHSHDDEHDHHHHHGCGGHQHSDGEGHGASAKRAASTLPKITRTPNSDKPYDKDSFLAFLNDPKIRLWTYAVGSTVLISAVPCFLLLLIPIKENSVEDSPLLRTLLAFGAGGLLGDAFLHLIPHATPSGHSHSHSHNAGEGHAHGPHDLSVGSWVLVGFMTFFIVEKSVRIMRGNDPPGHGHSHHRQQGDEKRRKKLAKFSDDEDELENPHKESDANEQRDETKKNAKKPAGRIRVAAFLNLVADFMHNFTDGLAIGASFIAGTMVGVVTVVTVLVHEVPHEIGDFAILVQSGFSKWKAMLIQLFTALGALAGCVLSLWHVDAAALAEAAEQSWAIPFTAGGFIYIGTVSMIPDLLEKSTVCQSVKEICALLLGLAMMYAIAFFE